MKKETETAVDEQPLKKAGPELPADTFGEYFAQMSWDHNCKKPGCYGRGHIGVVYTETKDANGKVTHVSRRIQPCSCLKYNPNGAYVELAKRIDSFEEVFSARMDHNFTNQAALFQFTKDKFFILENLSVIYRAFRLWDKIFGKKRTPNVTARVPEKKTEAETVPTSPIETADIAVDH